MELALPQEIDVGQVARLLGYRGASVPDAAAQTLIKSACARVLAVARPRYVWRLLPLSAAAALLQGEDIARHTAGCSACVLLGLTLGAGVDQCLRSLEATDMACAVAADMAASVLTEQMADAAQAAVQERLRQQGLYLTGRFSPGYGDWPLAIQGAFLSLLDAQRQIGLTATSTQLLAPRKSVTALCGAAQQPVQGRLAGCTHCVLREKCAYRKEGKSCAG